MKPIARRAFDADGRRKYLTKVEGQQFLRFAAFRSKREALFCLTLYYTGCRISEVLNLRDLDIDSSLSTLQIRSLKKREKKEFRRIPIPNFLSIQLLNLTKSSVDSRLWTFSRTTGWRLVKQTMKEAGISGVHATAKGLRHAFGVRGAMGGVPLSHIQKWMGHADVSTTAIYLDVRDDEERALISKTW